MRLKILVIASVIALGLTLATVKFWVPIGVSAQEAVEQAVVELMDTANAQLEAQGANYRVGITEYMTSGDGDQMGNIVISKDVGNKQLSNHFVPGDTRRIPWSGLTDDIVYAVDQLDAAPTLGLGATTAAIDRAMGSWQGQQCSNIPITKFPDIPGLNLGVVLGPGIIAGDINHSGWVFLPPPILGITFTLGFIDPTQLPSIVFTDIDNNGKMDTAFKDIYYSAVFPWAVDGVTNFDVETVALHEAGHGLSQGHFGKVFIDKKGNIKFAPLAALNAAYVNPQQNVLGTDEGGHCSIWASWPNN